MSTVKRRPAFAGFKATDRELRATWRVELEDRRFDVTAVMTATGHITDLQVNDRNETGTTGHAALDRWIRAAASEELARARSVAVVNRFDRERRKRLIG